MTYDVNTPGKAVQGKKKIKALQNVTPEVHCFCLGQEMSNHHVLLLCATESLKVIDLASDFKLAMVFV